MRGASAGVRVMRITFNSLSRDHTDDEVRRSMTVAPAFNSLSRDHMAGAATCHSSGSTPFNSLSRDHNDTALGNEIARKSFNSLSRDHLRVLSDAETESGGILSTPSLGITHTSLGSLTTTSRTFNSLSRDHVRVFGPDGHYWRAVAFNSLSRDHST